jgi:hypothetical protein
VIVVVELVDQPLFEFGYEFFFVFTFVEVVDIVTAVVVVVVDYIDISKLFVNKIMNFFLKIP